MNPIYIKSSFSNFCFVYLFSFFISSTVRCCELVKKNFVYWRIVNIFLFTDLQKGLTKIPRTEGTPTYLLYFSVYSKMH